MEPNTSRYAAVPTFPLSGGKLKMVTASFFSWFFFARRLAHCHIATTDQKSSNAVHEAVSGGRREDNTAGHAGDSSQNQCMLLRPLQ